MGGYVTRALGPRAPLYLAAALFIAIGLGSLLLPGSSSEERTDPSRQHSFRSARANRACCCRWHSISSIASRWASSSSSSRCTSIPWAPPIPRFAGATWRSSCCRSPCWQYVSGRLTDAIGPFKPLIFGSLAYGVVLCVVGFADLALLWPTMVALGLLAAVMFPPAIALTSMLSEPSTRGTAMGGFNFAGSLGFAIGPLVGGWMYAWNGYASAFLLSGSMEILLALVAALVRRPLGPCWIPVDQTKKKRGRQLPTAQRGVGTECSGDLTREESANRLGEGAWEPTPRLAYPLPRHESRSRRGPFSPARTRRSPSTSTSRCTGHLLE